MGSDGGLWPDGFKKYSTRPDWQRIESALTGGGIPDINGCLDGVEAWVELKFTTAWSVAFRPAQIGWAERRMRAGGRVWLATRRRHSGGPQKGPATDELWIHRGSDMRGVLDSGLHLGPSPALHFRGGPSHWDWDAVERLMFRT